VTKNKNISPFMGYIIPVFRGMKNSLFLGIDKIKILKYIYSTSQLFNFTTPKKLNNIKNPS
jgi:hypothetical protein